MIPPRNLSRLANRLAQAGGRRLPETVLERDYCLAWFLVALSRTPLRERLAFKGGTAIKRCYFGGYRFSEALDFTLATETSFEQIRRDLDPVFAEAKRATGAVFRFAREDRRTHANSHTFYLGYEGPLPGPAAGRELKLDIMTSSMRSSRSGPSAARSWLTCAASSRPRSPATGSSGVRGSPARWWTCPSSTRSTGWCVAPCDRPASLGSRRGP